MFSLAVKMFVSVFVLLLLPNAPARAQPFEAGHGINATTWYTWPRFKGFDRPGVVWPPFPHTRHMPQAADFAQISSMGFTSIRLGVDPALYQGLQGEKKIAIKKQLMGSVRAALDSGLRVVFDLHPNSRHKIYGQAVVLSSAAGAGLADYSAMVTELAADLSQFPTGSVALEIMNEPRLKCTGEDQQRWLQMLDELISRATEAAPQLPLVVSGACVSSIEGLLAIDPSRWKRDDLLFTFHFYEPFPFTHQSAPFTPWAEKHLSALPWPPEKGADLAAILAATEARLKLLPVQERIKAQAGATTVLYKYLASGAGAGSIATRLKQVADWADLHEVPRKAIYLGEFGVYGVDAKGNGATCEDKAAWVNDVRRAAEENGFSWSFFHLDGPFGLLEPESNKPNPALLTSLGFAKGGKCLQKTN